MDATTIATITLATCAVLGGGADLLVRGHSGLKRRRLVWERILGSPGDEKLGLPPVPGVFERLETIDDRTKQLEPNGGGSVADTVQRIEQKTDRAAILARTAAERAQSVEKLVGDHIIVDERMHAVLLRHVEEAAKT